VFSSFEIRIPAPIPRALQSPMPASVTYISTYRLLDPETPSLTIGIGIANANYWVVDGVLKYRYFSESDKTLRNCPWDAKTDFDLVAWAQGVFQDGEDYGPSFAVHLQAAQAAYRRGATSYLPVEEGLVTKALIDHPDLGEVQIRDDMVMLFTEWLTDPAEGAKYLTRGHPAHRS
jgi:hypothetical protein